jgi:hypothetical protein
MRLFQARMLAGHVVQQPALARLHACLADYRAQHIVVIAHDDSIQRVNYFTRVAFDIEQPAGGIFLVGAVRVFAIVGDSQKGTA